MTNIRAITTRIKYIAGLTWLAGLVSFSLIAGIFLSHDIIGYIIDFLREAVNFSPAHSIDPSFLVTGLLSNRQIHFPSRHSVSGIESSHCWLKKQLSFTETAKNSHYINNARLNLWHYSDFLTFSALIDVIRWHKLVATRTVALVAYRPRKATLLRHLAFITELEWTSWWGVWPWIRWNGNKKIIRLINHT